MSFLAYIIFGLIVGIVANLLDPRPWRGGIISAIILGILGSLLGGYLGNLLFGVGVTGFNVGSFAVAIAGALLLLMAGRVFTRPKTY